MTTQTLLRKIMCFFLGHDHTARYKMIGGDEHYKIVCLRCLKDFDDEWNLNRVLIITK